MDLLEIRKKAKQQKAKGKAPKQPAPEVEQSALPQPQATPAPEPSAAAGPAAAAKPAPAKKQPPAGKPRIDADDTIGSEFETFLKQSEKNSGTDLDRGRAGRAAGPEGAGLDALFLDLATEELYRHSSVTDDTVEYDEQEEVLCCMLASEQYGIDIHKIKEIIKNRDITEVPRAPEFIPGIITLRGRVIPVFDMRERLKLAKADLGRETKIVVVHHREELYGLIVDSVIDVYRFSKKSIEETPPVMAGVEAKFIAGIGRVVGEMVILLNLDEVLNIEAAAA